MRECLRSRIENMSSNATGTQLKKFTKCALKVKEQTIIIKNNNYKNV